jgi:L-seryl-tRNA(Ser) seleniumtransferase
MLTMGTEDDLRRLPSVDRLMQGPELERAAAEHGRALTIDAVREALEDARAAIRSGAACPTGGTLVADVQHRLSYADRGTLQAAINATGVIIHTNLGRAPLSAAARQAMADASRGYSNLEYDLEQGSRGSRYRHAEALLCRLTGAEAALVVNNNAGAVLLALAVLARGREVIVSRGQLVEIGGGFRVSDVMAQSGATLVEVGTTNRTYARDVKASIGPASAVIFVAHRSNFESSGFVADVPLHELVQLGADYGLAVVNDLGSGTLLDTSAFGLRPEPSVQQSVQAGVSLTTLSGDKLLGGPQAGIIVGMTRWVNAMRIHPLTRALRVDKSTLAALQATLLHYLRGEAVREIPVWQMIAGPFDRLRGLSERWAERLRDLGMAATVREGKSTIGGGSLPGQTLPTALVAIAVESPDLLASRLRLENPPVVARIEGGELLVDPRTVLPEDHDALLAGLIAAWRGMA